jgi:hypothetical protein
MALRCFVRGILSIAVLTLGASASLHGSFTEHRTTYVSFSAPVGLPGVALARGTYVFELADPLKDPTIVRVLSQDRSTMYFMGFTEMIQRAAGRPAQPVSLGEAVAGCPVPITAWYPSGDSNGRRFIYRQGHSRIAGRTDSR